MRIPQDTGPVAAWLVAAERPRPSSFIPAPPRASSPDLVAAPPASSDRLIDPNELTSLDYRTVPIRVDIERMTGRSYIGINPLEVTLHPGDGIEWDFRYFGGSDAEVHEVAIEFEKPAPFSRAVFRSQKPGSARPHRQLSGHSSGSTGGTRSVYIVRCFNVFKTEIARATAAIVFT